MTIFASSIKKDWRHRGERLSLGKSAHTLCESITIVLQLMAYHHFTASRITGNGNAVFPDEIIIDDDIVTYRKGQIVGYKETKINTAAIGCVSVKAGLIFADVIIETKGGMTIQARGFTRGDASTIRNLLY